MIPVSDLYNKARLAKAKPIILAYVESDTAIRCFGKTTPNVDHLDPDLNVFSWSPRVLIFGDYSQRVSSNSQDVFLSLTQEEMSSYTLTCDNTDFYFSRLVGRETFVGKRLWLTQGFDYPGFEYSDFIPLFLGTIQRVAPDNNQCIFTAQQTINPVAPEDPTVTLTKIYALTIEASEEETSIGASKTYSRTTTEEVFYTIEEWIYTTEIINETDEEELGLFRCNSQSSGYDRWAFAVDEDGHPYLSYCVDINATPKVYKDIVADFTVSGLTSSYTRLEFFADLDAGEIVIRDNHGHRYAEIVTKPELTYNSKWGSAGTGNGEFDAPKNIAVDANANVFVVDMLNHRIQVFDSDGTFLRKWGSLGSGEGEFHNPIGIALDSNNNVYVGDNFNYRIQVFDDEGTFIREWGEEGTGDGEFQRVWGVAITPDNNILCVDVGNRRIQRFSLGGTFISKFGSSGTGDGQFTTPAAVTTDTLGNIYVSDSGNNRVQKFTSAGVFISKFGSSGTGDGQFDSPGQVVVTSQYIYVTDSGNDRIQVFDLNENYLYQFGTLGTGDGQFDYPYGLGIDVLNKLYVCDSSNRRVQKFDIDDFFINLDFSESVPSSDDDFFVLEGGPGRMLNSTWCDTWTLTNTEITETDFPDLLERAPLTIDDGTWEEEITIKTLTNEEVTETVDATEQITLPNSGRYANPGPNQQNVILPHPYGDLRENSDADVWVAPLIDSVSYVYCVAAWPIQSVSNGNTVTVYVDGVETATGWTFDESNDYDSQGDIAILTFAADPEGTVSVKCNGKWVDGELLTNPVDIVSDFMDYAAEIVGTTVWEKDDTSFAEGRAFCEDNKFEGAGVILANNTLGYWIKNILASFMGSFSFNASGAVVLSFIVTKFAPNVIETIDEYEAISIKPEILLSNIVNQINTDYAISFATVDKRFKNNAQTSYFRTCEETGATNTPGAKTLDLSFDWNRSTASVEFIHDVLFALYGSQRFAVTYQGQDFKFLPVEMLDQIQATLKTVRDSDGEIDQDVIYELREKVMNLDSFTSRLVIEQLLPISVEPSALSVVLGSLRVKLGTKPVLLGGSE